MSESTTQQSAGGPSPDEPEPALSTDDVFELLSNQRRRYALHHLQQNGEKSDLGDISEHVASWENHITVPEVSSAERKRVYTSLQQFHLPKLDEKGIVEFDERAGTVELTEQAKDLDVYLEVVRGKDIPWSQYYLGLSAVNAALIAAVLVGAPPFSMLPDLAWGAFAVTTMLVSAVVHTYYNSAMRLGAMERPPEIEEGEP